MKVFKFGGASVKDAVAVRNVAAILEHHRNTPLVVVVSAMGKTTNALEKVVNAYRNGEPELQQHIDYVRNFHENIINELGFKPEHPVRDEVNNCFVEIDWIVETPSDKSYNWTYDQIVCMGELLSTRIVSAYLRENGMTNTWLDARDLILTDNTYREGKINWQETEQLVRQHIAPAIRFLNEPARPNLQEPSLGEHNGEIFGAPAHTP